MSLSISMALKLSSSFYIHLYFNKELRFLNLLYSYNRPENNSDGIENFYWEESYKLNLIIIINNYIDLGKINRNILL